MFCFFNVYVACDVWCDGVRVVSLFGACLLCGCVCVVCLMCLYAVIEMYCVLYGC